MQFSPQMPIFNAPKCLGLELRNRKFMISSCIRIAFNISSYIIDCQFPVHHLFTMRCFTYWMLANVFNQIQIRYSPLSDCDSHTYLTTSHTYPINCVALILQCNVVMHILHIIHTIISIFKTF